MITPVKVKSWIASEDTAPQTEQKVFLQFDLKEKLIALMNENTQLKSKQKILLNKIESLQYNSQKLKCEVDQFLRKVKCGSLNQARQLLSTLVWPSSQKDSPMLTELLSNINKNIASSNTVNLTNDLYSSVIKKKMQEFEQKYEKQMARLKKQNRSLSNENKQLKQNAAVFEDANFKLREELSSSIEKFQTIEALVDQKLKCYVDKIRECEEVIKKLRQEQHEFSFGRENSDDDLHKSEHRRSQDRYDVKQKDKENQKRKNNEEEEDLSSECYKASIQGLLEQNKRLKKSFQNLYQLKKGEQLPAQLLKEIHIMKSIIQLNEDQNN